jgi:hypothetical protein
MGLLLVPVGRAAVVVTPPIGVAVFDGHLDRLAEVDGIEEVIKPQPTPKHMTIPTINKMGPINLLDLKSQVTLSWDIINLK